MMDPSRVRVTGPLERYAPGFVVELVGVGYRPVSAALQLRLLAHLSRWMEQNELGPEQLSAVKAERFLVARRAAGYTSFLSPKALAPLFGYLRVLGVVPAVEASVLAPAELLLERYREYLIVERGLVAGTVRGYVDLVRPFVVSCAGQSGELDLAGLGPGDVLGFVLAESERRPRRAAKMLVTALRSMLGFLQVEGLIAVPLAPVVPSVAFWRLSGLPRGLESEQVDLLLSSCDRDAVVGRRDLAILLLLVRLGMRRGEVASLQLEDIDWRAGELLVRGKGARVERLPLPSDVGEAVAAYLRHGRPVDGEGRAVFMRVKAPRRAITSSGITQVVVSAGCRAGLGEVTAHRPGTRQRASCCAAARRSRRSVSCCATAPS